MGGQRWWLAAGSGSLGPTTRDRNGAGLRWRAEGGGFRRRRWGFGNGAFAAYAYPSPRKSVPVAPWADALGALLAAENARSDVSLWTDEELWAVRHRAGLPIWCALTRSHLVLACGEIGRIGMMELASVDWWL